MSGGDSSDQTKQTMTTVRAANAAEKMRGRACVITGATSGIGRAVAIELAKQGACLILVGRHPVRGEALASRLCRQHGSDSASFVRADLGSRREVEQLAGEIRNRFAVIDVLINNAGARFDEYGASPEGLERTFAGNHLGHFLLTALLLERLLLSLDSRIVTLGSGAHGVTPPAGWILSEANYDRKLAYGSSKLANIMFAYELSRRLRGTSVTVNAFDPGGVATRLGLNNGLKAWLKHIGYYLRKRQLLSPRRAGRDLVFLCTAPELRGQTGGYYSGGRKIQSSPLSHDRSWARALWRISLERSHLNAERLGRAWAYFAPEDDASSGESFDFLIE